MPFGPAWVAAWVCCLRLHCLPAAGQTGLWREAVAGARLESACPRLCCGELGDCRAALGRYQCLLRSSIPFCRTAGFSLKTVLAGSVSLGASNWGQWSQHLCLSHCYCHLPQSKRRTTWTSILGRRCDKRLSSTLVPPSAVPSGGREIRGLPLAVAERSAHFAWPQWHSDPQVSIWLWSLYYVQALSSVLLNILTYLILQIPHFTDEVTESQGVSVRSGGRIQIKTSMQLWPCSHLPHGSYLSRLSSGTPRINCY